MRRPALALLFLFLAATAARSQDLADRIHEIVNGPDYKKHARWGILVVDAKTGEELYTVNADRLFLPASTTKLYSCAAALVALGADHKFETPVYRTGPVAKGRLDGDLVLVASGDLTLGGRTDGNGKMAFQDEDHTYANGPTSKAKLTETDPLAGLKSLAKQIAASGIREVAGDVLIDDRLFNHERGSGSGPDRITPIIVNDNVVDVEVSPGERVGEPARIRVRPETQFIKAEIDVKTVAEDKPTEITIFSDEPNRFRVKGQIAEKHRPVVRVHAVENPAAFARALFIETLRREGVSVQASLDKATGKLPERKAYASLTAVAKFTSPELSEALKVTLKVSNNLYASTLPMLLAVKEGKRTLADGMRAQQKVLAGLGLDAGDVSFGGGAGGSPADHTTPRATVQLMRLMAKRPDYDVFRACLPRLGVDGTLAESVPPDSPARDKVQAKTGTLAYVDLFNDRGLLRSKALAGTMTTARGRTLMFAMFVNNVPLPKGVEPSREGKVLGKLCEVIYQHAP
jgi:serine-type D-Ala-D-Ala carboxypeptidase/endopeptidase (penicillin-binding protein 4)